MEINKLKVNKIFICYTLIYVYMERRKTGDDVCMTTTIMEEMRIKKNKILLKCFSTQQMLGRNEHFFAHL